MSQGGPVVIAYRKNSTFEVVAIKKTPAGSGDSSITRLTKTSHDNIVNLLDAFLCGGSIFIIYECMDTSLAEIDASLIELEEPHIAAVCHEVSLLMPSRCAVLIFIRFSRVSHICGLR